MHHESTAEKGQKIKLNTMLRCTGMRVEKVKRTEIIFQGVCKFFKFQTSKFLKQSYSETI